MVLLNKYIWFIETIRRHYRIDYKELNEEWMRASNINTYCEPLNKKTFQNYCKSIAKIFGIEISCDRRDGYRYYISEDIDEKGNVLKNWLLASLSISSQIGSNKEIADRIMLENVPSGERHLSQIIDAMKCNNVISIVYQSFWAKHESSFEVEPYGLRVIDRRWYLVGKTEWGDIRIFGLDRIWDVDFLERKFQLPEDFNLQEYFRNHYGAIITSDFPLSTIRIKVTGGQDNFLRSLPLHHTQMEIEHGNGYSIFEFRLYPTWDFTQKLLGFADNIEILAPSEYRNLFIDVITKMQKVYEGR